MINGDVNYYAIDPFNNPFQIDRDDWWPFSDPGAAPPKPDPPSHVEVDKIESNISILEELLEYEF